MNKTQRAKLRKLAKHLASDEPLKVGEFSFAVWFNPNNNCGCAIGETALIFRGWEITSDDIPLLKSMSTRYKSTHRSGEEFYGIDDKEFYHLFIPYCQNTELYGGTELSDFATRQEVAANMFEFLKRVKATTE